MLRILGFIVWMSYDGQAQKRAVYMVTIVMGYGWCKLKPFVMRSVSNAVIGNGASTTLVWKLWIVTHELEKGLPRLLSGVRGA